MGWLGWYGWYGWYGWHGWHGWLGYSGQTGQLTLNYIANEDVQSVGDKDAMGTRDGWDTLDIRDKCQVMFNTLQDRLDYGCGCKADF